MTGYDNTYRSKQQNSATRKTPGRDLLILHSFYKHRALTIEQVQRLHDMKGWYIYKKLAALKNKGYLTKGNVYGYQVGKKQQGAYYKITDKGITFLKVNGFDDVTLTASSLKIGREYLPHLLSFNDLMITLTEYGWNYKDSRSTKATYNINRGSLLHGMFISPSGKEYGVYITTTGITNMTLKKISTELMEQAFVLDNYLFFTKETNAYFKLTEELQKKEAIARASSLKVFSHLFGKYYLCDYPSDTLLFERLQTVFKGTLSFKTHFKKTYRHDGLDFVVDHNGEEKYIVNLIDTDLVKVDNIRRYTVDQYMLDKRRVLVVTMPQIIQRHRELLKNVKHVDYLEIRNDIIFG